MRLFVAVVPPPAALRDLSATVRGLTADADGTPPGPAGARWTADGDRHITLAFLGEVGPDVLPDLTARLGRAAARHRPPTLRLAGAGHFGDRVLWCGVRGQTEPLARLAASVTAAARRAGVPVEPRAFRAHLTLARRRGPGSLSGYAAALAGYEGADWRAEAVELIRSHPPRSGVPGERPRYETLRRWPLAG